MIHKKIISWAIIICLAVTLMPQIAFAEPAVDTSSEDIEKIMENISEEDVVRKTEDITTYGLGDGSEMTVFHGGQVRFENEEGKLTDYDPSLVPIEEGAETEQEVSLEGYSFRNHTGDKMHYLPDMLSEDTPILMEYGDYRIEISPKDKTINEAELSEEPAVLESEVMPGLYEEEEEKEINAVYGNDEDTAKFTYTSAEHGIKETITLSEIPETNVFEYIISIGDLKLKENATDEGLTIYDEKEDEIIAGIEAPWMNDDTGDAYSEDITYDITDEGNGVYTIIMTIDEEYLTSEERVYPVTVDPTLTWKGDNELRDAYVISGSYAGTNFYDSGTRIMPVGVNSTGTHRTYIKLRNLKPEISGRSIQSAVFTAYETGTGASNQKIRANRITEYWDATNVTWNNKPDMYTTSYINQVTTKKTSKTQHDFPMKIFIQNIANGTNPNYGFVLRNLSDNPSYAEFYGSRSTLTSYRPKLVIVHCSIPTKASSAYFSIKSEESGTKSGSHVYVQDSLDTTVNYSGITSDGLKRVEYRFWEYDEAAKTRGEIVVDYGVSSAITSGGTSPELEEGCYQAYVRGVNNADDHGTYRSVGFIHVDKTAPVISEFTVAPETSAGSYTNDDTPAITWESDDGHPSEDRTYDMHLSHAEVYVGDEKITDIEPADEARYEIPEGIIENTGTYEIGVRVYDKAGNSRYVSEEYYFDASAPEISKFEVSPATTAYNKSSNRNPEFEWSITDNSFKSVKLYINGEEMSQSQLQAEQTGFSFGQDVFSETGTYEISIRAEDSAGNVSGETVFYHLDIQQPEIDSLEISPQTSVLTPSAVLSPTITWSAADADIESISYSLDGQNWNDMSSLPYGQYTLPQDAFAGGAGTYTIYVKVTDKAGNESSISQLTYHLTSGENYVPENLAIAESYGKRHITWDLDSYNEDVTYELHRSDSVGFTPGASTLVEADLDAPSCLYIDRDVLEDKTYYYKIKVITSEGQEVSEEISIANILTEEELSLRNGFKDYLSYTSVELPQGDIQVEESSGNLTYTQDDFSVSNAQFDYGMSRTYNSKSSLTSMTGKGWSDSYHKELYSAGDDVYFADSDGSIYLFEKSGDSFACSETKEYALAQNEDGYQITDKEDVIYKFNKAGQLTEITEPNGCRVVNLYDKKGRLIKTVSYTNESMPKALDFVYASDSMLLDHVKDLAGTKYGYSFDGTILSELKIDGPQLTDGTIIYEYGYDQTELLNIIKDAVGNTYSTEYSSGKVSKITYPDGEYISFSYGQGRTDITKKISGEKTVFTENTVFDIATGKVLSHTDPSGDISSYEYSSDSPYLVVKEKIAKGYESINDSNIITIHAESAITDVQYTYNSSDDIIREETGDGSITVYVYSGNDIIKETTTKNSKRISETLYEYNDKGNLIKETDTVSNTVTEYKYDLDGNELSSLQVKLLETGDEIKIYETRNIFDDNGNVERTYEAYGNKVIDTSSQNKAACSYEYDHMGRVTKSVEEGITRQSEYDFIGRETKVTETDAGGDAQTQIIRTMTYNDNGNLASESEVSGVTKQYTYDSRNRNLSVVSSGTGSGSTVYGYEENVTVKNGISTITVPFAYTETAKDSNGNITSVSYIDNKGQTIKEVTGNTYIDYTFDKSGNQIVSYIGSLISSEANEYMIELTLYDEEGNDFANVINPVISNGKYAVGEDTVITYSEYDEDGNITLETDAEGIETVYGYDNEGRLISCDVDPDESGEDDISVSYELLGNGNTVTTVIDAKGNQKEEETDAAGNVVRTTDSGAGSEEITVYYVYDELGRLIETKYNDGTSQDYEYSGNTGNISGGNLLTPKGEAEESTDMVYNEKGQVTKTTVRGLNNMSAMEVDSKYDAEGKLNETSTTYTEEDAVGTVILEETQDIRYEYDNEGRVIKVVNDSDSETGQTEYIYDTLGNLSQIKCDGEVLREYVYDGFGRVKTIKMHDEPGSTSYILESYIYDNFGRTQSISYTDNGTSGTMLESYGYSYDKNGNIINMTHVNNMPADGNKINESRAYSYDNYGRLTETVITDHLSENSQKEILYEYDAVGNRTKMTVDGEVTTYEYNGLDQLISVTSGEETTEYGYDQMGNQIAEENLATGEITMNEFSASGQLTKVSKPSDEEDGEDIVVQINTYDHNGKRIKKEGCDGTSRYYFYDYGNISYTMDGTDELSVSSSNILTPSGSVAATIRTGSYHTYLKDIQGSTGSIVKEDGILSAAYKYSDFGEAEEVIGSSFDNEICYTGQVYDDETGLYYYNARYYDPVNGRFISQDTYRGETDDPGTWHLYAYCANDPINYVDPSGHKFVRYYDRLAARNMYVLLRAFDITRQALGIVGGYGTVKALLKLVMKKNYKKFAKELIEEIGTNIQEKILFLRIKNVYEYFKEGFRKGGYDYLSVTKIVKKKGKKAKKIKVKEKIIRTKLIISKATWRLYGMNFYYSSKSRSNVLL